jgi:antitoxin CptB
MSEQINRKKLEWQCRRGMLELDVILRPFLEQYFDSLNPQQQQAFVELLSFPDPDIYTWIMGFGDCEHLSLAEILTKIRKLMKVA